MNNLKIPIIILAIVAAVLGFSELAGDVAVVAKVLFFVMVGLLIFLPFVEGHGTKPSSK